MAKLASRGKPQRGSTFQIHFVQNRVKLSATIPKAYAKLLCKRPFRKVVTVGMVVQQQVVSSVSFLHDFENRTVSRRIFVRSCQKLPLV